MSRKSLLALLGGLVLVLVAAGRGGSPSALAVPANDNLAGAIAVTTPAGAPDIVAVGSNSGATTEASENLPCGSISATIWYTWTSPGAPGTVVFDTWGSNFDTVLAAYSGSAYPLTNLACNDDFFSLGGSGSSAISFAYASSTTYFIQVGGFFGGSGEVVLNLGLGAAMYVNSTLDTDARDGVLTLREGMLVSSGGLSPAALTASESGRILNAAAAGGAGADLIHFSSVTFPASSPAQITLGLTLPDTGGSDTVSGVGAGVIIDGNSAFFVCMWTLSSGNHIEGLQLRKCDGLAISGNNNIVGGTLIPAQRNIIHDMDIYGIALAGNGNRVVGNYVGTDATGMIAIGNPDGISLGFSSTGNIIGGSAPGEGNLISGNTIGIHTLAPGVGGNQIIGNKIGVNATLWGPLPNGTGIRINSTKNMTVGGILPGAGNIIAYSSASAGVVVTGAAATGNKIRGNSIYGNAGGGIDINSGGNLDLSPPIIGSVTGGQVKGIACPNCTVDAYNDVFGEGRIYLGSGSADGSGNFAVSISGYTLGYVTATNTDAGGNTSEFSWAFTAPPNADGDGLPDASDACPNVAEDYDGWQDGDGCPDPDNDSDGICDTGMASVSCMGSDTGKMVFDPAGTLSSPTLDCRNIAEDYDAFKDTDGCPEPDNDNDGHLDASDQCPGTDAQAGIDGMLGSSQDLNHNGIKDGAEANLSTDDVVVTVEDWDGVIDADGCHDSPGDDYDGDSFGLTDAGGLALFRDEREALFLGTHPTQPCALTLTANDEPDPDAWPFDFNDDQRAGLPDVLKFIPVFGAISPSPQYNPRYDLNASGGITLPDVLLFIQVFGASCIR